jgi:hypothetical protein
VIHRPYSEEDLREAIQAERPRWLRRADRLTRENIAAQRDLSGDTNPWTRIKGALQDLQGQKCGYCERKVWGRRDCAIDHYRPKKAISAWTSQLTPDEDLGPASEVGYYRWVHDPRNYVVSCSICNSDHKGTAFPVAGPRGLHTEGYDDLADERPLLLMPAGDWNDDPETIIQFRGPVPCPHPDAGEHDVRRANVTIELLDLALREDLLIERASVLRAVWNAVRNMTAPRNAEEERRARRELDDATHPEAPHAACARAFEQLCFDEPDVAERVVDLTAMYRGTFS